MYIRIADGVTRGMLKWGDWEGLTEKVRLELRLKGLRGGWPREHMEKSIPGRATEQRSWSDSMSGVFREQH